MNWSTGPIFIKLRLHARKHRINPHRPHVGYPNRFLPDKMSILVQFCITLSILFLYTLIARGRCAMFETAIFTGFAIEVCFRAFPLKSEHVSDVPVTTPMSQSFAILPSPFWTSTFMRTGESPPLFSTILNL